MHHSLIRSIAVLQKSKYGKGNKHQLRAIQSALKLATPLFSKEEKKEDPKLISFRKLEQSEHIPKIFEEFVKNFEIYCLAKNGASAKNYSLFSVTMLKIIKTLDADKKRGLLSAHAINVLNKFFEKHPVEYKKIQIRDPMAFVFVITELAIDVERNLSKPYEFDIILLRQVAPLMQRYHMKYDNALHQIISEFAQMPKFRLAAEIGERHTEIVKKFLEFGIVGLPLEDRISRAKHIIEKIITQKTDSDALEYYNMLKLCFSDKELCPHLAEFARSKDRSARRFANTILDEVSNL